MEINKEAVEAAGFKIDAAGKIRDQRGHLVNKEAAEQVASGAIIANFDINAMRKKAARAAATGGVSLVDQLAQISPAIALLKVGQTARVPFPDFKAAVPEGEKPQTKRSFIMSIVSKLNNLTQKDREWEGRVFEGLSDDESGVYYVSRLPDTDEPHVRTNLGGRPKKNADNNLSNALAAAKEHLGGEKPNADDAKAVATGEAAADGEAVVIGNAEGGKVEQTEEAQVIKA